MDAAKHHLRVWTIFWIRRALGVTGYTILGLALLAPVVLVIVLAAYKMRQIRSTYSQTQAMVGAGVTGQQAGRQMLDHAGLQAVPVQELPPQRQPWESYFDMSDKVLRLAPDVFQGRSAGDLGITAYECSHAVEFFQSGSSTARQRQGIFTVLGANLGLLLFILGVLCLMGGLVCGAVLAPFGFLIFALTAVLVLVGLPAEKATAKRAADLLVSSGLVPAGSAAQQGAQQVIQASTWYYVGALSSFVGLWFAGLGIVVGGPEP
jgi:Zn-dependent membrane protease YugP